MKKINEDTIVEQPVIEWLKSLGYDYEFGPDIAPGGPFAERDDFRQVVLAKRLRRSLKRIHPQYPDTVIDEAIRQVMQFSHPNLVLGNYEFYKKLVTDGITIESKDREVPYVVRLIDFDQPQNNEFLCTNQFAIQGPDRVRRPDVIVFVNGLPLVVFELKSPTTNSGTMYSAYQQIEDYKKDITDLFVFNQFVVISDLLEAKHGTITAPWERFATWKGVESENEENDPSSELETTIRGIFPKERLIDIMRNFIVHEADSIDDATTYTKKMAMYHQYFGVNKAIGETLRATAEGGDGKVGVFWHTQGSGKSLSMVFYTNKVRRLQELESPTLLFITDRNDLDDQLLKTFKLNGYGRAKQAESVAKLKERLSTAGAEVIFSTIQKFDSETGEKYPILTERRNVIVIADEAHRSQYAVFAGNVREGLPNASFMGVTGTPISQDDKDTQNTFGPVFTSYRIEQAVKDGATVPIYYEGRLVPLHVSNQFIDEEFESMSDERELAMDERDVAKKKFATLEAAVGADDRLEEVAKDIIEHFNGRGLEGKAMVVTISRHVAKRMYQIMSAMPDAPEMAVVVSKLEEFKGEVQKETRIKEIEKRFKKAGDPLKLVIVCDMWLTGFDVPSMHTLYMDKPLKNHTLMQAIARVNRVYKDKKGGLIVDYIGIADNLKKALSLYSSDIQKEAMIPITDLIAKMDEKFDIVRSMFTSLEIKGWKKMDATEQADIFARGYNTVVTNPDSGVLDESRKKRFLNESVALFKLHALVMPHAEAHEIREEVEFFQAVKKAIVKRMSGDGPGGFAGEAESALRELVSKSITAEGVIDIFQMQGKDKPEISIFDDAFLEEVKNYKFKNLAIDVMKKLLDDQIKARMKKNIVRYKSLLEMLEDILEKYENNIINSGQVIEKLIALAKEIREVEHAGDELGLSEEELAFYDALASYGKRGINDDDMKKIVQRIVKTIKRDIAVDWTNNEQIKARIKANVRLVLLQNQIDALMSEKLVESIYYQATKMYENFVPSDIK